MISSAGRGDLETVTHFMDLGVAPDAEDAHGNRAINMAIRYAQLDMVKLLLERGASVNEADGTGRTPLLACAERDAIDLFDTLLAYGANIHARGEEGRTALIECAANNSIHVAHRLLQMGVAVNSAQDDGSTALHEAILVACEDYISPDTNAMVVMLLNAGADKNLADVQGTTPLLLAQQYVEEIDYVTLLSQHVITE